MQNILKNHSVTFLVLFLMLTTSCGPIVKLVYGVKPLKARSAKTISSFVEKKGTSLPTVYTMDMNSYVETLKAFRLPSVLVFDKNGNRILQYAADDTTNGCTGGIPSFLMSLSTDNEPGISNDTDLNTEISKLRSLTGEPIDFELNSETDYVVIGFWAYALGGILYKEHALEWEKAIKMNPHSSIEMLSVSMDPAEWWGEGWEQSMEDKIMEAMSTSKR